MAKKRRRIEDRRCVTCKHFFIDMPSLCKWEPTGNNAKFSDAFRLGGVGHTMRFNDGKECDTWELEINLEKIRHG